MTNEQNPREVRVPVEKRGGYTGNQDPGKPTGLMQQQTVPVNQGPSEPSSAGGEPPQAPPKQGK